ncbi:MAG TPA: hypothetical protein VGG74_15635 [Kofleriaceae bacterium]
MKLHVFFSVLERIFGPIVETLRRDHGLGSVSGFVWGVDQVQVLRELGVSAAPLTVFSRDILANLDDRPADVAYLAEWERRCGVPIQHMIFAERHLISRHPYDRLLRLTELIFRRVESDFDTLRPDAYFSEDVACLTSFIHWAVARDRGVKITFLNNARFPGRVTTYSNPFQQWDLLDAVFPETPTGYLSDDDLTDADKFLNEFRERPTRMPGLAFRARLDVISKFDLTRLRIAARRWREDPGNPTLRSPGEVLLQRGRRLARSYVADARGLFDRSVEGERYVLYPLHLQPEATTLVLAPYYLNQLALIEDIAKSLPIGHWLYVKEHVISRGRWPLSFYEAIRRVPGVRLLSADEDAIALIRNAAAIAVITGTMGWEGILLDKPVVTFGRVFFNRYSLVHRAGELPKVNLPSVMRQAIFEHQSDPALLRRFVACALRATFPGITGNPASLPIILEPDNVKNLTRVVGSRLGLMPPLRGGLRAA